MRLSFPEAEVTRSLYNKIFKNNQVTYGRPFQVKIPLNLQNIEEPDPGIETDEEPDEAEKSSPGPEELLEQAKCEYELILKEAGFEADRLLEQARQEAEEQAEKLFEEAWQKGYAEGMEAARKQNEAILEEAEQIRLSASEEHESILAGMEAEIVELVLDIARKAVAGELATNRGVIMQLAADALSKCSSKNGAVLRVSAEDYSYLNENMETLKSMAEGADDLEIKKDHALKQGDCIVESLFGSSDAGVSTRMDKIEEAFREELEGRQQ